MFPKGMNFIPKDMNFIPKDMNVFPENMNTDFLKPANLVRNFVLRAVFVGLCSASFAAVGIL